jgi:hypothetical protein
MKRIVTFDGMLCEAIFGQLSWKRGGKYRQKTTYRFSSAPCVRHFCIAMELELKIHTRNNRNKFVFLIAFLAIFTHTHRRYTHKTSKK